MNGKDTQQRYIYHPSRDLVNEETYIYTGVPRDTLGYLIFLLSAVNIALTFLLYKAALFIGLFVLLAARYARKSYQSPAAAASLYLGRLSVVVSGIIWIISVAVFGG